MSLFHIYLFYLFIYFFGVLQHEPRSDISLILGFVPKF